MIKKLFLTLLMLTIIAPLSAFAFDNCSIVVKDNESYMMFIDERPAYISVEKPAVLKVQSAADLFNQNYQLVIKALKKGETDVLITTAKGKQYTINVKVEENPVISNEVFEIDPPPGF